MPVWCEVVADTLTPVGCFANVVGEGEGFLFESVEGGERWGRYSFVGRRPLATLTARGHDVAATGRLGLAGSGEGFRAVEALVARYQSPALPGLPPLHGGLVGYLGYDVVREVERLPHPPADDQGQPDADARRDRPVLRVRPLASAHRAGGERRGAGHARRRRGRRRGRRGVRRRVRRVWLSWPPTVRARLRGRLGWRPRPAPSCSRPTRSGPCRPRSTWQRSTWPRSTSARVTSSRWCCRSATT